MQQQSVGADAPCVHIITDSASDLVQGELDGVSAVVPLSIAFGDKEYLDGVDLSHDRFYEKLVSPMSFRAPARCRRSRSHRRLRACSARRRGGSDEAVVITLSAKLSGTHESALAAAQAWGGRVHVVDSTNVTIGQKALVGVCGALGEAGHVGGSDRLRARRCEGPHPLGRAA